MSWPRRAQAAQYGVLVRRPPARHHETHDRQYRDRHDVEQAEVQIAQHQVTRDGDGDPQQQSRNKDRDRREPIHAPVRPRGEDVLLGDELQRVGDGLKRAVKAHAHRAHAHLYTR